MTTNPDSTTARPVYAIILNPNGTCIPLDRPVNTTDVDDHIGGGAVSSQVRLKNDDDAMLIEDPGDVWFDTAASPGEHDHFYERKPGGDENRVAKEVVHTPEHGFFEPHGVVILATPTNHTPMLDRTLSFLTDAANARKRTSAASDRLTTLRPAANGAGLTR